MTDIRELIEMLRRHDLGARISLPRHAADVLERLLAVVEEVAHDTDDCVSPGMKAKALAALGQTEGKLND